MRNALTGAAFIKDFATARGHEYQAGAPTRNAEHLSGEIAALEARIAASPSNAEKAMLGQTLEDMRTEMQGFAEMADSPRFAAEAETRQRLAEESRASSPDQVAAILAREAQIAKIPMNPYARAAGDPEGETFWEKTKNSLGSFAQDPVGVSRTFGLRAAGTSLPSILSGILGTSLGGPAMGATGAGSAGFVTELGASISQDVGPLLQAAGVDTTDAEAIAGFLRANPDAFDEALQKGLKRAGIIGATDAISGGTIGALAQRAATKGAGTRVAAAVGGGLAEGATEGLGEGLAMKFTGDGVVNPGEILAEVIGGTTIGAPSTVVQTGLAAMPRRQKPTQGPPAAPPQQGPAMPPPTQGPTQPGPGPAVQGPPVPKGFFPLPDPGAEAPAAAAPAAPDPAPTPPAAPDPAAAPAPDPAPAAPAAPAPPAPEPAPEPPAAPAAPEPAPEPPAAPTPPEGAQAPAAAPAAPEPAAAPAAPEPAPAAVQNPVPIAPPVEPDEDLSPLQKIEHFVGEAARHGRDPARPGDYSENLRAAKPQIEAEIAKLSVDEQQGPYIAALSGKLATFEGEAAAAPAETAAAPSVSQTAPAAPETAPQPEPQPEPLAGPLDPIAAVPEGHPLSGTREGEAVDAVEVKLVSDVLAEAKLDLRSLTPEQALARTPLDMRAVASDAKYLRILSEMKARIMAAPAAPDPAAAPAEATAAPAEATAAPATPAAPAAPEGEVDGLGNPLNPGGGGIAAPSATEVRKAANAKKKSEKAAEAEASEARAAAAQEEMDALVAEIEKRNEDTGLPGEKPKDVQARFESDMAEIETHADALRQANGLTDDEMPTAKYTLRRGSGTTSYTVDTRNDEKGRSGVAEFRKRMARGRSGMSPRGKTVNSPSTGPAQRFSDAAPQKPRPGDEITPSGSSTTERASENEQTFRDAGLDPDEAQLMPGRKRVALLGKALADKFGIPVSRKPGNKGADAQDATDQLLDAFRNLQFMASVLGIGEKALSLGGRVKLSLERRNTKYLGVYYHDTQTIGLPGRSNSFAHEWMHAVDHFLRDRLRPGSFNALLSQVTRAEGLDPTAALEGAYVNLVHRLFFDEAALADRAMALEVEAQKTDKLGNPTKGAVKAERQLTELREGSTRLKIAPSKLRSGSAKLPNGKYLASVHELVARAFEAYIGFKVAQAEGGNEVITKGDAAYLNELNEYMEAVYPKASERMAIFAAFDDLFTELVAQQVLGTEPGAAIPADAEVYNARAISLAAGQVREPGVGQAIRAEGRKLLNLIKTDNSRTRGARLKEGVSEMALNSGLNPNRSVGGNLKYLGKRTLRMMHHLVGSVRGVAKSLVKAQPKTAQPALQFLLDGVMTDPGTGKEVAFTFEEHRDAETNKAAGEIEKILRANGFGKKLKAKDNDIIRDLMLGKPRSAVTGATDAHVKVAGFLRRMQNEMRREGNKAGLDIGYIENTGYFQRVLLNSKVHLAAEKFAHDAAKVYRIVYDGLVADISDKDMLRMATVVSNRVAPETDAATDGPFAAQIKKIRKLLRDLKKAEELAQQTHSYAAVDTINQEISGVIKELKDLVRDPYAEIAALDWKGRVLVGDSMSFDSMGPAADFVKHRTLPPEADDILAEWYETDVLTSVLSYTGSVTSRAAYVRHYGTTNGNGKLNQALRRSEVRAGIQSNPSKYDTGTARGRANIIRDLTDARKDNRAAMAIWEAQEQGANGEDVTMIKGIVEQITGRTVRHDATMAASNAVAAGIYVLTYITLLPRATLTALTEPITYALRTGDVKGTFRVMGKYLTEAVRSLDSVQERAELARQIGIVSTKLHDVVMLNRLSGDFGNAVGSNVILANYFRANMLAQVTNAQRRAMMDGGFFWLRDLAKQYADPNTDTARKNIIKAEFAELGIGEDSVDAAVDYMKDRTELWALDDLDTFAGDMTAKAVARFVDQTIQNPRRADKPLLAATPAGRVIFALTSFLYTFQRNVHLATYERTKRDYRITREAGAGKVGAGVAAGIPAAQSLGIGFGMMWAGQMVVSAAREAIFNQDQWEQREEEDELFSWLGSRALSRTGAAGPFDVLMNAVFGIRYERDLANMLVGPGLSSKLAQIQRMITATGGVGRNSENTNTAEWAGAKAAYQFFGVPALSLFLSALPVGGPVSATARYSALLGGTSNTAAEGFADALAGPKPPKGGSQGIGLY